MTSSAPAPDVPHTKRTSRKNALTAACAAHATHDGLCDLVYVFLPVWQDMFMLGYVWLSVLRSAYALTLAALQIPVTSLTSNVRPVHLLVGSTAVTALGWLLAGLAGSAVGLGAALVVAGIGASVQHPVASAMVSRAYGSGAKRPLGIYNFAGDVGKSVLPASAAVLLTYGSYRNVIFVYAGVGVLAALLIGALLKRTDTVHASPERSRPARDINGVTETPGAFRALLATAILDSAVRMGFLTFLPFIIKSSGGSLAQTGVGLTLVFIGGAVGKFCCGWMADSLGSTRAIMLTEVATALLIVLVLTTPLTIAMLTLPFLGVVLNGTSSVLYGAVTDVVDTPGHARAFSVFYTGTIGAGALAPVLYGYVGDHAGIAAAVIVIAVTAAVSFLPVTIAALRHPEEVGDSR
ncbi:MFS transporter [Pseudomonas sp. SLFW]|uniref:MFS transporter n=1 Tax=Pseudomonas sp. SLFW TaxID=2683259 RepID=UPI0014123B00|nr:MFS transporter [Pseudomonas sp. SLFW]NBB09304.1 MFS transporter [Pseudomonas sp. SLFW]